MIATTKNYICQSINVSDATFIDFAILNGSCNLMPMSTESFHFTALKPRFSPAFGNGTGQHRWDETALCDDSPAPGILRTVGMDRQRCVQASRPAGSKESEIGGLN
jgi:hypothetical protein